jgi:hypothetical protein
MRLVLGRIALLAGVALVAAMAWYGATSLFEDDAPDDPSSGDVECAATSGRNEVRLARRALVREHGDARWFGGARIGRTEEGFVVRVTYRTDRLPPGLPSCQGTVRVLAVRERAGSG